VRTIPRGLAPSYIPFFLGRRPAFTSSISRVRSDFRKGWLWAISLGTDSIPFPPPNHYQSEPLCLSLEDASLSCSSLIPVSNGQWYINPGPVNAPVPGLQVLAIVSRSHLLYLDFRPNRLLPILTCLVSGSLGRLTSFPGWGSPQPALPMVKLLRTHCVLLVL
jgi:hypothetical protein